MHANVSVWDDGPTYTHRQGTLVTSASGGGLWRIQLPRSATSAWPDDVTGYQCLLTTEEGGHIAGEILVDSTDGAKRYLLIPRTDATSTQSTQLRPVGHGTLP